MSLHGWFSGEGIHDHHTMRFGSTAKELAECQIKYYRISECIILLRGSDCCLPALARTLTGSR